MTQVRTLKEKLKNHEVVFGTFYKLNSPIATEMIGWSGMDFIVVDCEHGSIGYESVENIVRCADSTGLSTVVRVASDSEEHILHALDSGAEGVQIPDMKTVEQFEKAVNACKYFPLGTRGLSRGTRSSKFGFWDEAEKPYVQAANERSLVVVHIENKEMADAIEEICRIPEIDVVFVGPADLSQSLGIPGKSRDPLVVETACQVIETAERYGKAGGINVTNQQDMDMYINRGARYIMYGSDTGIFAKGLKTTVAQFAPYKVKKED